MKVLIKIIQQNGNKAVSARDLYQFLKVSYRFSKWFEFQLEYGFEENVDYTPYKTVHPQNGQEITDYILSIDTAKEISMIQRSEKGRQARQYFIEMEKITKEPVKHLFLSNSSREERIASRATLIDMIKLNLLHGDIKQISEETGLNYKMLRGVLYGTHQSERYLKALYTKALENRKASNQNYTQMILDLK